MRASGFAFLHKLERASGLVKNVSGFGFRVLGFGFRV